MTTLEYAPGRHADVYADDRRPTVLLWHGMQTDSRAAVAPLAESIAAHGLCVVAADWDSHADDGGRADLLASVEFARDRSPEGLILVGWSMGGLAAAGVTLEASRLGVHLLHTICLAGAFTARDPISGGPLTQSPLGAGEGTPFTLLHGTADDVVPVEVSRDFAARLHDIDWPVEVVELATDHGAIAGAVYDPVADRYDPATDDETLRVATDVAARIAAVAGR